MLDETIIRRYLRAHVLARRASIRSRRVRWRKVAQSLVGAYDAAILRQTALMRGSTQWPLVWGATLYEMQMAKMYV